MPIGVPQGMAGLREHVDKAAIPVSGRAGRSTPAAAECMRVRNRWAPDPFLTVVITLPDRQRIALARKQIRQAFAWTVVPFRLIVVSARVRRLNCSADHTGCCPSSALSR